MKITTEFADEFAAEWISAWNAHDLERILSHYSEKISFHSPFISPIGFGDNDVISDIQTLRSYFERALDLYPTLYFDFHNVFAGTDSIVMDYISIRNLKAAEMMCFDENGKVTEVRAHYRAQ
jgi:hypothetical protein